MFGFHKKTKTFDEWLDNILENFDMDACAFNFNIYENKKGFSTELIATASFDKDDEDWACDEIFASRDDNNEFYFSAKNWESALALVEDNIKQYLQNGKYADKLKSTQGVACGFVDGDLIVLYSK